MLGKIKQDLQQNLFKTRLTELINMDHPLVKLAHEISWDKIEAEFEGLFSKEGRVLFRHWTNLGKSSMSIIWMW